MALIETQSLRHSYRIGGTSVWAVDGISLTIKRGEFVAVMGPSGSGKSTFLYLMGCLARPTAGSYTLDGVDVSRLGRNALAAIRNKKLGFVFQNFNLLPRMSALENVQVPLQYTRTAWRERCRCAEAALEQLGLADLASRTPSQLSGGEQQRVAIARALVNNPPLLLADEPTGALDTTTSKEIMSIFKRLNRESRLTILLVTHEPEIAAYAKRVVTIRDGRVMADERRARKQRRPRRVKRPPTHVAV